MVRMRDLIALTLLLRQLEKGSGCSSGLVLISLSPSSSSVLDFWFFFPMATQEDKLQMIGESQLWASMIISIIFAIVSR